MPYPFYSPVSPRRTLRSAATVTTPTAMRSRGLAVDRPSITHPAELGDSWLTWRGLAKESRPWRFGLWAAYVAGVASSNTPLTLGFGELAVALAGGYAISSGASLFLSLSLHGAIVLTNAQAFTWWDSLFQKYRSRP